MAQIMTKRIPVSEDIWKKLGKIKEAGQTYDELIKEMIIDHNRKELVKEIRAAKKGEGNWHKLEDM